MPQTVEDERANFALFDSLAMSVLASLQSDEQAIQGKATPAAANSFRTGHLFERVASALQKHHHKPDLQAVLGAYAAIAAHRLPGQPVWAMLVAPPGSMKTDLLAALEGLPRVHLLDCLTPNTFLSVQVKDRKGPVTGHSPSLLHRIGLSGIIAYPDFSTLLSMNRDRRGSVLADMRRIYDGHLRKEYGTDDDPKMREWKGRITFAVATTDEGRPLLLGFSNARRALHQDSVESARWHGGSIDSNGSELRSTCNGPQRGCSWINERTRHPASGTLACHAGRIAALAEFTVRARTHIHRNGYSKEIEYVPEPEAATRLAQQLAQLSKGSALVREKLSRARGGLPTRQACWI